MSRTGAFVVTGSGSGIGQAIADALARQGHFVFGLGRDVSKLQKTQEMMPKGHFAHSAVDLADAESSKWAVSEIRQWLAEMHLPLLGLVNNAGVFDRIDFHLTSDAIWERHFHNNLLAAVRLTRELHPELLKGNPSSVLNISSTLGIRPIRGTSAYSAIKAAMVNWTQTLALEWAEGGIRVNCICPGLVDTPIHGFQSDQDPARVQANQMQPMGRMGLPADIAEMAVFLMGRQSNWTTGSVVTVDGGISL